MTHEAESENRPRKIEAQLFQIKLLLIIIADLCILGFYGLTRMNWDDIDGILTRIWEVFIVIGLIATLAFPLIGLVSRNSRPELSTTEANPKHTPHSEDVSV